MRGRGLGLSVHNAAATMTAATVMVAVMVAVITGGMGTAWAQVESAEAAETAVSVRPPADIVDWYVLVESGSEYDTNIHRFSEDQDRTGIVAAPLARLGARLRMRARVKPRHVVQAGVYGGAKLFASRESQDENLVALSTDAAYQWRMPERDAVLAAHGSYQDRFAYEPFGLPDEPVPQRNYSVARGAVALTLIGETGHRLTLSGGYRYSRYKLASDYNWHGDHYEARYQTSIWRQSDDSGEDSAIDLLFSYGIERRRYRGDALRNICPISASVDDMTDIACLRTVEDVGRSDFHHSASAEMVYTSGRIYSARYDILVNDSNSYGQSLRRHRVALAVTTELVRQIFATARVTLQLDSYPDALLLFRESPVPDTDEIIALEGENRNALSLHLARDVSDRWSVEARYALFSNAFGADAPRFQRQLYYLGAVYAYGR